MQPGVVFVSGVIENSPEGIYMTDSDIGRNLVWAAKVGWAHDWVIYCYWESAGLDYALSNGDTVCSESNIRKLVPCDEEAFKRYRY